MRLMRFDVDDEKIVIEKDKALEPLDLIDDIDDIIKNINIEEISSVFNSSLSIFIKEE